MSNSLDRDRIQPYDQNPSYWQYKGRPVLLLGGSVEDNLFQIPNIRAHLDLLASVGGNYVRCTMSSRDPGDVWPFERDPASGRYDLRQLGHEYWRRFQQFLDLTAERDIILQIEVWDRFDFAREPWEDNPFNPKNNINYTSRQSGLAEVITTHPGARESAFFRTVPELENNTVVLPYQHALVDGMLSRSLRCGNVLYCMDNETNESPAWPAYWAQYIRNKAAQAGAGVELTEMWDAHDLADPQHERTWMHPELYSFVDISQNNHQSHQAHWDNMQAYRQKILSSGCIRPINTVKIYGANAGRFGTSRDGQERFWRNIFGGLASTRFHRPASGLGLSETAQAHIRSARLLAGAMDVFACEPHNDLLDWRSRNEAYCLANPGVEYAVFFPDGGNVVLDTAACHESPLTVRWLAIRSGGWYEPVPVPREGRATRLITPAEDGYWVALVKPIPTDAR
jgi:hypothetical protein